MEFTSLSKRNRFSCGNRTTGSAVHKKILQRSGSNAAGETLNRDRGPKSAGTLHSCLWLGQATVRRRGVLHEKDDFMFGYFAAVGRGWFRRADRCSIGRLADSDSRRNVDRRG